MKTTIAVATAMALLGSLTAVAQMPPPAPPSGASAPKVDGPPMGRPETQRFIMIRGEDGPRMMHHRQGGHGSGLVGALGLDPRPLERLANSLNLTPQQQGKVTELVATVRPEMRKLSQEIVAESRRLRDLDPADAKYAAQSSEISRKIGELSTRLVQQSADLQSSVWKVLTAEQRTQAANMRQQMQQRMQQMQERKKKMHERGTHGERPPKAQVADGDDQDSEST